MCKIITFNFNNLEVRTATKDNNNLFCLIDCCNILNLKQPSRVLERLDKDGVTQIKGVSKTTNQYGVTTEQEVNLNFISEPNLYRVIFRSDKPEAVKFQDWVFNEVLPALRKDGKYELGKNDELVEKHQTSAIVKNTNIEVLNSNQNNKLIDNELISTNNNKPKTLLPDKDGFYSLIIYFSKLRYVINNEEVLFLLDDIDCFLEVKRLNGIDRERTENNYTIHNILCDYNITPFGKRINGVTYDFLKLPQLIEFCDRYKTKRSLMLQEILEYKITEHICEQLKRIQSENKQLEENKQAFITA